MSTSSPNYSDFFIDYIEQFTEPTVVDKMAASGYKPFKSLPRLVCSESSFFDDPLGQSDPDDPYADADTIGLTLDNITQINNDIITRNINDIELSKEDIYSLMSTLSIDDLSLFSPKIELWRRLPSYVVTNAASDSATKDESYVYKKFDFVDGWNQIAPSGRRPNAGEIASGLVSANGSVGDFNESILNGSTGYGVAAILGASWELHGSSTGLQGGPEIYDYLNKIGASISKFNITFKFDSVATFFGNSQGNGQELITNFLKDPKTYIQEMSERGIEGNAVTRNYSYLMFFGDITEENNKAELNDNNTHEAYRFKIKVGYEPIDWSIDEIIQDPQRKERIIRFNNFLKRYPDYFNLIFKAYLGEYAFEFGIDNSITLKCIFGGNVQQGSIDENLSYKRKEFNFLKVLEEKAVEAEASGNIQQQIEQAQVSIRDNQQLINEYEILSRAGCSPEITKNLRFRQSLEKELEESRTLINSIKEKSWSYFLDNVPIHTLNTKDGTTALNNWTNSVLSWKENSVTSNFLELGTLTLTTLENQQKIELDAEKIKKEAEEGQSARTGGFLFDATSVNISFFFFGDLVNNIIESFISYHNKSDNHKYDDLLCTMPTLEIYKRSILDSTESLSFGTSARIQKINAAYVPISMFTFRQWVYRNIIAKKREYYFLFDLLSDLKLLLTEAINYKTTEILNSEQVLKNLNGKPLMYSTFYNTSFEILSDSFVPDIFKLFKKELYSKEILVNVLTDINLNQPPSNQSFEINKDIIICGYAGQTLFKNSQILNEIYNFEVKDGEQSQNKSTSAGDFATDIKLGIVHFYIGNQLGLAKNFSFKAGPAPKQIETQAANETRTTDNIRNIRYDDVEIKLVGGNFFRPTELIYVHPHYTFGEPFEKTLTMSNILNIGGYYTIISINSTFTQDGKYETTLTAKYLVQAHDAANRDKCSNTISPLLKAKFAEYSSGVSAASAALVETAAGKTGGGRQNDI